MYLSRWYVLSIQVHCSIQTGSRDTHSAASVRPCVVYIRAHSHSHSAEWIAPSGYPNLGNASLFPWGVPSSPVPGPILNVRSNMTPPGFPFRAETSPIPAIGACCRAACQLPSAANVIDAVRRPRGGPHSSPTWAECDAPRKHDHPFLSGPEYVESGDWGFPNPPQCHPQDPSKNTLGTSWRSPPQHAACLRRALPVAQYLHW